MSPELLDPSRLDDPDPRPTKASDCYALGMVIYEVRPHELPRFLVSFNLMYSLGTLWTRALRWFKLGRGKWCNPARDSTA